MGWKRGRILKFLENFWKLYAAPNVFSFTSGPGTGVDAGGGT